MKKFAFISRHTETTEQIELAIEQGIKIVNIGDMDAFSVKPEDILHIGDFDGVIVVHPAAALRLSKVFPVGVFENGQRSEENGKLTFFAKALHIYE